MNVEYKKINGIKNRIYEAYLELRLVRKDNNTK